MNKTKVCIITEETIPPIQRFSLTLRLAETLGKECQVHLVAIGRNSSTDYLPKNVWFHPIEVKGWDLFSLRQRIRANIKLLRKVLKICDKHDIDLIYGWWPISFLASIFTKTPFAVDMPEFIELMYKSFHKPFPNLMKFPLKWFQTLAAKKSKALLTESSFAIEEWRRRGVRKDKMYAIPYGVEVNFLQNTGSEGIREKYGIPSDDIVIMYHGDIGFDDGVDVLIKAVRELDVWCMIIGDGSKRYMNFLKSIANGKTIFTGWILYPKIPEYLAVCDIYVAPFRSSNYTNTTYPLKQMESMAAGKPTICSRITAFSKVVSDGYDIKLVAPGNMSELNSAIKELAGNRHLRDILGKNGYNTAKEKFDWKVRVDKEIDLLKKVIKNNS